MNPPTNTNIDVTHHVRWQIPRASLSSGSGSRSMYSSTDSIQGSIDRQNKFINNHRLRNGRRESYSTGSDTKTKKLSERRDEGPYSMPSSSVSSISSTMHPNNNNSNKNMKKFSRRKFSESLIMNGCQIDQLSSVADERVHGSSSSQGSSSNSLHVSHI